ncbi:restriction endonuclease fold toxin-2 domain-containing protein [Streptomyces sp. NPDC014636]
MRRCPIRGTVSCGGLEIITNDQEAAPYWQSMMVMSGVTGTARYVP